MADDDEDPVPTLRLRRAQTQTERDLAGIRARRERERKARDARRDAVAELTGGVVKDLDDAVPDEFGDVDTGVTERIKSDPELRLLFAKSERNRALVLKAMKEAADRDLEIAGERPADDRLNDLELAGAKYKTIERRVKWVWFALTAVAIPAIASLVMVARYLYDRAVVETRAEIIREQDHHTVEELSKHVSDLERRLHDVEGLADRNGQKLDRLHRLGAGSDK